MAVVLIVIVFVFVRAMPGDPVDIMMGSGGNVSAEQIQDMRDELKLDEPLWQQLSHFFQGVVTGDLGYSLTTRQPVGPLLLETFPATIELALAALLFAVGIGLSMGVVSAVFQRSLIDRLGMGVSFLGISMPAFWLGLLLILVFAITWQVLPTSGRLEPGMILHRRTGFYLIDSLLAGDLAAFRSTVSHLILPAVTLGAELVAIVARVSRSSMIEVLRNDYVSLARAKGVSARGVVLAHALPNALIPTVTVVGLQMGVLLGGNMIVETVFGWPGLGRLVVQSIFARDYAVIQAAVALYAVTFLLINLGVDLVYTYLNPRIAL